MNYSEILKINASLLTKQNNYYQNYSISLNHFPLPLNPTPERSIGLKPIFNAGDSGFNE